MLSTRKISTFTFITRSGFPPKHSRACYTPWSVFQDGSFKAITPTSQVLAYRIPQSQLTHTTRDYNTAKLPHFSGLCLPVKIDAGLSTGKYTRQKPSWVPADTTDFKRFPFNNFTYCFTLFPKCFSSFPHGTCSLSVSRLYLALDGIYHPFWAAFPNNSTLWKRITKHRQSVSKTGFSPSMTLYSKRLVHGPAQKTLL